MNGINVKETYEALAKALPWELQTTLLSLRDAQGDNEALRKLYYEMPTIVYCALQELCLITVWCDYKNEGMKLTTAGEHLVKYCTC